jgi:hypothetical protein
LIEEVLEHVRKKFRSDDIAKDQIEEAVKVSTDNVFTGCIVIVQRNCCYKLFVSYVKHNYCAEHMASFIPQNRCDERLLGIVGDK